MSYGVSKVPSVKKACSIESMGLDSDKKLRSMESITTVYLQGMLYGDNRDLSVIRRHFIGSQ
jgi:hypothetical protein